MQSFVFNTVPQLLSATDSAFELAVHCRAMGKLVATGAKAQSTFDSYEAQLLEEPERSPQVSMDFKEPSGETMEANE